MGSAQGVKHRPGRDGEWIFKARHDDQVAVRQCVQSEFWGAAQASGEAHRSSAGCAYTQF
ncbi:hypothetical protein [Streptomyces sp. NPDC057909]|uniref:hypothetical protein n=1 Tax=Streptomyces sp. NPDC057909 TaxID=3346277 RepID=UPI0036EEBB63